MNDKLIKSLIGMLNDEVPREGGRLKVEQHVAGPNVTTISANKVGFLRFGIDMLDAAFDPAGIRHKATSLPQDLAYLCSCDANINFAWFERANPDYMRVSRWFRKWRVPIAAFFLTVIPLAAIGVHTIAHWFGHS